MADEGREDAAKRILDGDLVCIAGFVLWELQAASRWIKRLTVYYRWCTSLEQKEREEHRDGQRTPERPHPTTLIITPLDAAVIEESPVGKRGG